MPSLNALQGMMVSQVNFTLEAGAIPIRDVRWNFAFSVDLDSTGMPVWWKNTPQTAKIPLIDLFGGLIDNIGSDGGMFCSRLGDDGDMCYEIGKVSGEGAEL